MRVTRQNNKEYQIILNVLHHDRVLHALEFLDFLIQTRS